MTSKYFKLLIAFVLLLLESCSKQFDAANHNPNSPTFITPDVLLTAAEGDIAYTFGGDIARYTGAFMQYIGSGNSGRQADQWFLYNFSNSDFNQPWANLYAGAFKNLISLKTISDNRNYYYFSGISRCLLAFGFQETTDLWNSIPYNDAFQGYSNLKPKYDQQELIYDSIFALTDQALVLFAKRDTLSSEYFGGDIIYGGSITKWTNFVHALRARAFIHLAKINNINYVKALEEANASNFSSSSDDARFYFFNATTGNAPMYQYLTTRGDFIFSNTFDSLLMSLNDPRENVFNFTKASDGIGPYFVSNQALPLLTNVEIQFIKAECLLKTGSSDGIVRSAYLAGISQSFSDHNLTSSYASYINQDSVNPSGPVTLNNIIRQKYIAMYLDPEAYNDLRRTGFPVLTPLVGSTIPERFLYPQSEVDNNNVPLVTIFSKIWWEQ